MPALTDHDSIAAAVRSALAGDARWTFIADAAPGRTVIAGLAAVVLLQGTDPDDVTHAGFDFLVVPIRRKLSVTLLSVPRSALTANDIRDLLAGVGLRVPPRDGQDVFLLTDEPGYLIGVLELLRRGKCFPAGTPANN